MSFLSLSFPVFLVATVGAFFLVPKRWQWGVLLLASYVFYASWGVLSVVLLLWTTMLHYVGAVTIGKAKNHGKRRAILFFCIVADVGLLFFCKYAAFFSRSVDEAAVWFGTAPPALQLPVIAIVGVSFFTFQAMAYVIDVYRGTSAPERSLGILALSFAFFPKILQGPIERAGHLHAQLRAGHAFHATRVFEGLRLMLWGFFQKIVIANQAAIVVSQVYAAPESFSGSALLFVTYLFTFQIYADFAGYTDIARGAARIFGIDLLQNFDRPYAATSIADFWRRWHLTLSFWFRDYVYIPLGGNRLSLPYWCGAILIIFLLSGLWHGAAWTFVVWGCIHGLSIILDRLLQPVGAFLDTHLFHRSFLRVRHACSVLLTFHILVFSWVFFRAQTLADAFLIVRKIFTELPAFVSHIESDTFATVTKGFVIDSLDVLILVACVAFFMFVEHARAFPVAVARFTALPTWIRWGAYYVVILLILTFGRFEIQPFIYFQF